MTEILLPTRNSVPEAPTPAGDALIPWAVERVGDAIALGGVEVHTTVARDLWRRLGELLEEGERDAAQAEWSRLAVELDRAFASGRPARGTTVGKGRTFVEGVIVRDREGHATFRVASFAIVLLRAVKNGWEGQGYSLRPLVIGHELRPLGVRVRVSSEAVPALATTARQIEGPATSRRGVQPPCRPVMPSIVLAQRSAARDDQAALLAVVPVPGAIATLEAFAQATLLRRDVIRGHLEALVDLGDVEELSGTTWRRLHRVAFAERRPAKGKASGTRLVPAPARAGRVRSKKVPPPSPPVLLPLRSCFKCNTAARTANARCPVCRAEYSPA